MWSRGNHRPRRKYEIDRRTNGNGRSSRNPGDQGQQKGCRWRTSRQHRARQSQGGKKATPKKKAPRSARNDVREGSKTATILELLKRPGGVTAKDLLKATNWQPHSLRGFLSGTVGKKMGLPVASTKGEDGERNYSLKS